MVRKRNIKDSDKHLSSKSPSNLLRAADRYAYTGCGSTAYSVGTVYGGRGHLYTPGVCPGLLATPCIASLATPRRLAGDHLMPHRRSPYASPATPCRFIDDALLALLGLTTETRPTHNTSVRSTN